MAEFDHIRRSAPPRADRWALTGLVVSVVLLALFLANWSSPVLRTVSPTANAGIAVIGCMLPWPAAVCAKALSIGATRWLLGACLAMVGLLFLPFAGFALLDAKAYADAGDRDGGYRIVSQAQFDHSNVVGYETNGGATTDYGFVVRQERPLGLGIILVRELYSRYRSQGGTVERIAPERVRILPEGAPDAETELAVLPWVWF